MARQIVIDFGAEGFSLIHRIRNFGESLYHMCLEDGWASISLEDVDRATNQLRVTVRSARKVRRILSMIEKLLDRHGLATIARLSQVSPEK